MNFTALVILGVILLVTIAPFTSLTMRLVLLSMLLVVYGKTIILYYTLLGGVLTLAITHNPSLYRSLSHMMVYNHFECLTKIPDPPCSSLYVCNYPETYLEFFVPGVFPRKMCVMTSVEGGSKAIHWAIPKEQIIYVIRSKKKDNKQFELTMSKVKDKLSKGLSVFAYVDNKNKRYYEGDICPLYHGMFAFSKALKVPIIPVAIDQIRLDPILRIKNKSFHLSVGRTHIVDNIDKSMSEVRDFFRDSLSLFKSSDARSTK